MNQNNKLLDFTGIILLIIVCASWGIQQVAIKIANQGISPVLQAGIRSIGASILILGWMKLRHHPVLNKDKTLWWGLGAGLLFSVEFMLIYWGLKFTNASRAVIFLYMSPFFVALGAQFFIPGEQLGKVQITGLCTAFIGIIVAFSESMGMPDSQMLLGDLMLSVAALIWGATTVLIKACPLAAIPPGKTLLYQLSVSALLLPLTSMLMGEPGVMEQSPLIIACILYQIIWVAAITYLIWFWMISRYSVSRLSSFTFLTPLFGVLAGAIFLNESITVNLLLSLVFVASGIYLVNRPRPVTVFLKQ